VNYTHLPLCASYSSSTFRHFASLFARTGARLQIFSNVCWLIPLRMNSCLGSLRFSAVSHRLLQRSLYVCRTWGGAQKDIYGTPLVLLGPGLRGWQELPISECSVRVVRSTLPLEFSSV
jgi:hypothetical protein